MTSRENSGRREGCSNALWALTTVVKVGIVVFPSVWIVTSMLIERMRA